MSPLKETRKGNTFEGRVAAACDTERRIKHGTKDQGDLVLKRWVAEIFCPGRGKKLNLSQKMTEAKVEAANAGVENYCVIARRTGYPIEEAFFVIPLWKARELGIPE